MGNFSTVIDMVGQQFGKLTVLSRAPNKRRQAHWNCICECGKETIVIGSSLRLGRTTSCGCNKIVGSLKTARKLLSKNPREFSAKQIYQLHYNDGNLTFEQFLKLSQGPCYYCNNPASTSNVYNRYRRRTLKFGTALENITDADFHYNGLDRLNSLEPHNIDNVVPCCKWCNYAKMDRSLEDFKEWIKQVHRTFVENKKGTVV